jgi:predicted ArsR family transcriptional regulator
LRLEGALKPCDVSRFDALGDPDLRATLAFARGRRDPVTAGDVAAGLDVSPSVARWRLERLLEQGFLVPRFVRRGRRTGPGAGRPAKTYAVAPETTALEFPRRRYEELVRLLIEVVPRRGRGERLAELGLAFGRELARTAGVRPAVRAATALDRVCRALGTLGFQAAVESVAPDRAVVVTPTCPLRPLVANANPAREIDQGMWRGLVAAALRGRDAADVRCETHECLAGDASCRILIGLSRPIAAASPGVRP